MSIPNNLPISFLNACAYGFNCDQCGNRSVRTPFRYNNDGPFFCCLLCCYDYQAANGDTIAAERAASIRRITSFRNADS